MNVRVFRRTRFAIGEACTRRAADRLALNDTTLAAATLDVGVDRGARIAVGETFGLGTANEPRFTDATRATATGFVWTLPFTGLAVRGTRWFDRATDEATIGVATGAAATGRVFAGNLARRTVVGARHVADAALIWRAAATAGRGGGAVTVVAALLAGTGAAMTGSTFLAIAGGAIFSIGIGTADAFGTGSGEMADVGRRADRAGNADTIDADVVDGTGVAVAARRAVCHGWVDAVTGVGVAGSVLETGVL